MAAFANDDEIDISSDEEEMDLSNSDVCTKYKMSADVVNNSLKGIIMQCKVGAKIKDICTFGNTVVEAQCQKVFKKKKYEKGIAFPTCISVNECVCHFAPLSNDETVLKEGDMVKIDLGCHIDGFIAVAAFTHILTEGEITGKQADVMLAAYTAAQVSAKLIKPGNTNTQVTDAIKKVADSFEVNSCQGTLMHQQKQFVIDGNKTIIQREEVDQKVDEIKFEANEVYSVDICMSSGEGKPKEKDARTTVFKRAVEQSYHLKMKASRAVFNAVNNKFPTLPFCVTGLGLEERIARMGVVECVKHDLLHPYPVLYETEGDYVAHFKFTVLLLPSGTSIITGGPTSGVERCVSDKTLDEEMVAVMKTSSKKKKRKKKKKKKKAADGDAKAAATE